MRQPYGVLLGPEHADRVARYVGGALKAADALGRIPTPLDDVTQALRLADPHDLLELGEAPPQFLGLLRRLKGKVLGALAVRERVIYLDRSQLWERQRFAHAHELGHEGLPWHRDAYYGDDKHTLHPDTRVLLESEANRFAADLLFQLDQFAEMAGESPLGMAVPLDLASTFGTSRHAGLRRYVETNPRACALLTLGRFLIHPAGNPSLKVLTAEESPTFRERYGHLSRLLPNSLPVDEWPLARDAYEAIRGAQPDPILAGRIKVPDSKRGPVTFEYEIFSNTYAGFALLYPRRPSLRRGTKALWTPDRGVCLGPTITIQD